ncbi:putative dethiobiotin synthetase with nucleotide triphosphate hydrolase domain [Xenorhabdus bovienii str. Jollieti]|uniref:ATP-dependent dethiobiotin synthetase BioD n=1 Tax=Xenorhabdus bovienii (strain SS-2004) TaxID=406818 RepID=D3V1A4_XENBS|nr:dethiobiotin synthase [Xenorhabdus bovienii]CBJ81448.1 putative dethiobiotin synthetase with nucleotide triphosphate hydrolase domain [Xenorhabdus bovienii SS-2004]CDH27230.1 putative dethiobiotin synthetase with nucleotide triphosphate hydrolase domain [Xenorhabdus bovienii str. Jollieti]
MLTRLFVTGTDTNIGKTVVTRALLQVFNREGTTAVGYKPIATEKQETPEGIRNHDALVIHKSSPVQVSYEEINPIIWESNYEEGNQINFVQMTKSLKNLSQKADRVIIEGNGGWRLLLQDDSFYSDWVVQEKLPVILVVGIQAGCVSHAILTAQSIINDGVPLIGWIANRINPGLAHYAKTLDRLRYHIPAPQLGEIPYLLRPEERDLSCYLDVSAIFKFDN